ncbi:MAG: hypothetical protein AAF502_11680 [Bacteroidota bacterium]
MRTLFFALVIFCSACSSQTQTPEENPAEDLPQPTAPTETSDLTSEIDQDEPSELNAETLSGEWIMDGYDMAKYIHVDGMDDDQKNNFERIIDNLIGNMRFVFVEDGNYEGFTGLPFHFEGNWFIDENGANLTLQQENEVHGELKKPTPKSNVYVINHFSKNFMILSDTDNLTFVFKKS